MKEAYSYSSEIGWSNSFALSGPKGEKPLYMMTMYPYRRGQVGSKTNLYSFMRQGWTIETSDCGDGCQPVEFSCNTRSKRYVENEYPGSWRSLQEDACCFPQNPPPVGAEYLREGIPSVCFSGPHCR